MTQRAARNGEGGEDIHTWDKVTAVGQQCERTTRKDAHITSIQFQIPPSLQYTYSFLFIVLIFSRLSSLLVSTNLKKGNMSHKSNGEVKETKYIQCNLLYNEDWQDERERVREREHIRSDDEMNQNRMNHNHLQNEFTGETKQVDAFAHNPQQIVVFTASTFIPPSSSLFSLCFWVCHHFNFILIRFALTSKSTVKWVGVVFVVVEP